MGRFTGDQGFAIRGGVSQSNFTPGNRRVGGSYEDTRHVGKGGRCVEQDRAPAPCGRRDEHRPQDTHRVIGEHRVEQVIPVHHRRERAGEYEGRREEERRPVEDNLMRAVGGQFHDSRCVGRGGRCVEQDRAPAPRGRRNEDHHDAHRVTGEHRVEQAIPVHHRRERAGEHRGPTEVPVVARVAPSVAEQQQRLQGKISLLKSDIARKDAARMAAPGNVPGRASGQPQPNVTWPPLPPPLPWPLGRRRRRWRVAVPIDMVMCR